jgi:hypothetical protein
MNCHALRRRLLATERPDRADPDAGRHLDGCTACRTWRDRLVELERQLPLLPAPPADGAREALKRRLLEATPVPEPPVIRPFLPPPPTPRERALRKLAVAVALVAALLLLAVGIALLPHQTPQAPRTDTELAERRARRDQRVDAARTPRERVEVLATIADELREEALTLSPAERPQKMRVIARFYGEVVRVDLPNNADKLSAQERRAVIEMVAKQLQDAESELSRKAALTPPDDPLHELAIAAGDGRDRMRERLRGA